MRSAPLAPPSSFRVWVAWQTLFAALPIVIVLTALYIRRAARLPDELAVRKPWRVWVRDPQAPPGSVIRAMAARPGGRVTETSTSVYPLQTGPATTTQSIQLLQVMLMDTTRLIGQESVSLGSYALVGPTVEAGGSRWQEAWRMPLYEPVRTEDSDGSAAGTWDFVGKAGIAGRRRLDPDGTHNGPGKDERQWASRDGLLVVRWKDKVRDPKLAQAWMADLMIGTLSGDGLAFEGIDWLGNPVSGKKAK